MFFALQLRGPFGAGLRARFSALLALCTAGSTRTLPRHSLYYLISGIIRVNLDMSIEEFFWISGSSVPERYNYTQEHRIRSEPAPAVGQLASWRDPRQGNKHLHQR